MPYDPKDMFKLYAYSYFNGIRSSRRIERECHRNIEVMWLINELKPDFKTIANFRKDNKEAIKGVFRRFTMICDELGLISKEVVAVDGSKFRACNGRMRYHSKGKIAEKLLHYTEAAKKYMNLLEQCDKQEEQTETTQCNQEELKEKLAKIQKRVTELEKIAEQVEEKNHFVVAVDAASKAVDYAQLHNIASKAKEELQVDELTAIADKGYYSGEQFAKCKADNIKAIAPHPDKGGAQERRYTKGYFKNDKGNDRYIYPNGSVLAQSVRKRTNRKGVRYYNPAACAGCPMKEKCTPKTKYRTIVRGEFDDYTEEVDDYTKQNVKLFAKRKSLAEHPFETVKRALGYTYFLTRGTENVLTETFLHFLAYNMKRLITILGVQDLKVRLQG